MTTTINASTSAGLVQTADTSGSLALQTAGTTAITVDTSANVGIGTTSPSYKTEVKGSAAIIGVTGTGTSSNYLAVGNTNASNTFYFGQDNSTGNNFNTGTAYGPVLWTNASSQTFVTNSGTNVMTYSGGNLLVGKTSQSGSEGIALVRPANTATYIYMLKNTQLEMTMGAKSSTDTNFYVGTGSSSVGTYGVYLTNTGNSWNAVSDERQKNIIESIDNGLEKVSTLRAVIGSYKHDPKEIRRPFLIAQDVQAVLPEAVNIQDEETGTLGMSYTDVIPLLVASIKELKAINDTQAETLSQQATLINALTARIVALEGK